MASDIPTIILDKDGLNATKVPYRTTSIVTQNSDFSFDNKIGLNATEAWNSVKAKRTIKAVDNDNNVVVIPFHAATFAETCILTATATERNPYGCSGGE